MMEKKDSIFCNCLYYSSNALSRLMTKMADEEFASTGLSSSYAFLLMTINCNPGIHPKEISEQMQLTPSTITRLLERLEHKNLLVRKAIGRIIEVYPTEKSIALDKDIKDAWNNLYTRYVSIIGEDEAKNLTASIYDAVRKIE